MAGMSVGGYNALFGSLNGSYNAMSSMSNILGNYNQIKSGQYSQLMKAYVDKVGNKEALNAYRTTGTTVQNAAEMSADKETSKTTKSRGSSWLDENVGASAKAAAAAAKEKAAATSSESTSSGSTTKSVSKYHNSFLDNRLASYDSDGAKKTTAETSGGIVDTNV